MSFEHHADELPLGVFSGVFVVFYEAGLGCIDAMVATHCAILARKPFGAALTKYDGAGVDVFLCRSKFD